MPYINEEYRSRASIAPQTPGELNFSVTETVINYLEDKGESYTTYNDILGALEGAKLELYRRRVAPYEDDKRIANGDVY